MLKTRKELIAALAPRECKAVLEGLPLQTLERMAASEPDWRLPAIKGNGRALADYGDRWRLPGEKGNWSVYAVRFDDGCVYVGMTSRMVFDRLEEHFGEGERGNGVGTLAIVQHRQAGIAYHFEVLDSGLQEQEARDREAVEIHALTQPLNAMFASRDYHCPNTCIDPAQGAVARFHQNLRQ